VAEGPVTIVGGGPAGLAAAVELRRLGVGQVVVIEREREAGGIPRHARHQGFGLRDLRRPLTGPAYARRYADLARSAGAELLLETMVTGWAEGALELTGPGGRSTLEPAAVVLATGCRERPRSARLVPGSRPEGVMTTGMLQQLVYLQGLPAGRRALVVGAEHVREGLELEATPRAPAAPPRMPNIGEAFPRPYRQAELVASDPDYGRMVCFCERVTRGEIRDALASPVPPVDLDGLRRRTRAHMGRCQGFFCGARLAGMLAEADRG
jgi:NADPH-dependent 2,4-dienoyl-CoA reductase/sulfur reductase-like enzyme